MKYFLLIINFQLLLTNAVFCQNTWTQKADFGGAARRSAIGFCIGNYGYLGTGYDSNFYDDLWKYDPVNDVWTQVASYPGSARFCAVAFVLSTNAYVGTGYDVNNNFNTADFWKYDAVANSWSQSASMPAGQERRYACAFSAQGRGYVGTGVGAAGYLNDLWQYDGGSNTWTQKSNFPGAARYECVAFTIGEYGYIACGSFAGTIYTDFYEYQPQNDAWVQRANYPGAGGDAAAGFSLEGRGFIGTGSTQGSYPVDFYEWNQFTDTWTAKANFPAAGRAFGTGFSVSGKGYVGIGEGTGYFNDWWEYTPDSLFNSVETFSGNEKIPGIIFYNGKIITKNITDAALLTLYYTSGKEVLEKIIDDDEAVLPVNLASGIYIYKVASSAKSFGGKIFITGE
jgi:N-acetylneuraminic acid mutarotase